ncbi:hypothetical protein HGRIS_006754 [Hohenbuehelia grisea]|uniref:AB hydrolase-1 domain-containing protein n=1 Tax=Hohenbuehelia grisea TaxID=104357 RepID=A0ABR3JAC6_9AGAR
MSTSSLKSELIVLDSPGNAHLKMVAKRYTSGDESNAQGLTLLLAHSIGAQKEHWEPTLEKLFASQADKPPQQRVREAYSFDWQSHGDSAVLNEKYLLEQPDGIAVKEWGRAIASFIADSDRVRGHRLILVGHSVGSFATLYAADGLESRLTGIILIESPMIDRKAYRKLLTHIEGAHTAMKRMTLARRDDWPNTGAAIAWLQKRMPYNTWDERILQTIARDGFHTLPKGTVTTKTPKQQEAAAFKLAADASTDGWEIAEAVGLKVPVHKIYGSVVDLMPRYTTDGMVDREPKPYVASTVEIADRGHLIVQQDPDVIASEISKILDGLPPSSTRSTPSCRL